MNGPTSQGGPAVTTAELFAGIGGFRVAADRLGLKTVFANDIDPTAADVYRTRFGDDVFVEGDIHEILDLVPEHLILSGGFPCQPYSYAGKKKGRGDHRANTLDAITHLLKRLRPPVFVLENVKSLLSMAHGIHFAAVVRELNEVGYGVAWRVRNAMEFGLPQNRQRVLFLGWDLELTDVSESDLIEVGFFDDHLGEAAQGGPIADHASSFAEIGVAAEGFYRTEGRLTIPGKSPVPLSSILEEEVGERYDFTESTKRRIRDSKPVGEFIDGVEVLFNQEGGRRMGYTIYGTAGAAPTLTSTTSRHYERFWVSGRYRRLTPVEYARLQGFDDDHASSASHAQQYVLYGSAIPPVMAKWALSSASRLVRQLTGAEAT